MSIGGLGGPGGSNFIQGPSDAPSTTGAKAAGPAGKLPSSDETMVQQKNKPESPITGNLDLIKDQDKGLGSTKAAFTKEAIFNQITDPGVFKEAAAGVAKDAPSTIGNTIAEISSQALVRAKNKE